MPRRNVSTKKRSRSRSRSRTTKRSRGLSLTGRSMVKFAARRRARPIPKKTRAKAKPEARRKPKGILRKGKYSRKTRIPKDPRPPTTRARSVNATSAPSTLQVYVPQTMDQVMTEYRKQPTLKQVVNKKVQKLKKQIGSAKERKNAIAKAIEITARNVSRVASVVEPMSIGMAGWQPETAPFALPAAAIAHGIKRRSDAIEMAAKGAQGHKDAFRDLVDTFKLRRAVGRAATLPDTNLITMSEVPPDRIPPAPQPPSIRYTPPPGWRTFGGPVEEID